MGNNTIKISGFAMVRNADKYYFPIKESIESILPIVDEFIVALGNCDRDDRTEEIIKSIGSDKIKIFHRTWDESLFIDGLIFQVETNFALSQCTGDWCFYLQADEVVHEKDLVTIQEMCQKYIDKPEVEGFLFKYKHFWGDYDHILNFHSWYKNEIRIIRNNINISSYKDAQSFRLNKRKLNVKKINAEIYHYGWVRPPQLMIKKKKEQNTMHHGVENTEQTNEKDEPLFDYGALGNIPLYNGSHPSVMQERINSISWKKNLNYTREAKLNRGKTNHERTKYIIISWIENKLLGGKQLFGYSNWNVL